MVHAEALLRGPRGRRLLLEVALEQERARFPDSGSGPLGRALFDAAYRVAADRGDSVTLFGPGTDATRAQVVTPEEVAAELARTRESEPPPPGLLLRALARSVRAATYWQEPDGEDVVCAHPEVRRELSRYASRVAALAGAQWWGEGLARSDQWVRAWDETSPTAPSPPRSAAAVLEADRAQTVAGEARAARERPADPAASWSGTWWSCPPSALTRSARRDADGVPVGLCLVEDRLDWSGAEVRRLEVPGDLDVVEIRGAGDWAELCRSHPLEVSAEKRHDWHRATGRAGRWVVPDWVAVAREHHAVHLTVAGYLAAAGTVVAVDDDVASVIAGWNPDETCWLTDRVRASGEPEGWRVLDGEDWEPDVP